jgi:hypothetical protein
MQSRYLRIFPTIVTLALLVVGVIASPVAYAIESGGVGGKPANPRADNARTQSIFIYELKPGASVKDAVLVINNTDQQKTINVYPVDSQVSSGGAFACAQAVDISTSVGKWVTMEKTSVTVDAKSKTVMPFTITVPKDADVGEHNGCVAIQPVEDEKKTDKNGVVLNFRSAIRVAVTVPGKIEKALTVKDFTVVQTTKKVRLTPVLANTGNVSLDSEIRLSLKGVLGQEVSHDGGTFPVLRGQQSSYNFELPKPFWGGWYKANTAVTYAYDPNDSLGNKDSKTRTITADRLVFVAPQPAALGVMGAAALVVAGLVGLLVFRKLKFNRIASESRRHLVEEGEDLQSIAADYRTPWQTLVKLNGLKPPYSLKPGQKIVVPAQKSQKTLIKK